MCFAKTQFHSQDVLVKPMPQITGGYKKTLIYLENNAIQKMQKINIFSEKEDSNKLNEGTIEERQRQE